MTVFHGSNHNFTKLKISKSFMTKDASLYNEGLGIYFSALQNVARSYGRYLYVLEINDSKLIDFTKKEVCLKYVKGMATSVRKQTGIDISKYFDFASVAEYAYYGNIAIYKIHREIQMLLDSSEMWYREVSEKDMKKINGLLEKYDKNALKAYTFNYNIPMIGIIKDVSDDIVRIADKRKIG